MDSRVIKKKLIEQLTGACQEFIELCKLELNGQLIYGFGIFCDSAFVSMSGTIATMEGLRERTGLKDPVRCADLVNLVHCNSWGNFGHDQVFYDVNRTLDEFFSVVYDDYFEDLGAAEMDTEQTDQFISDYFTEVILSVYVNLIKLDCFKGPEFIEDVLLGVQFSDVNDKHFTIMKNISKKINSVFWHEKVSKCVY